jgi:hypothetical protein
MSYPSASESIFWVTIFTSNHGLGSFVVLQVPRLISGMQAEGPEKDEKRIPVV